MIFASQCSGNLAHNHPSGAAEPSQADRHITQRLEEALALIDVRVLHHIVVGDDTVSFAERGLLWLLPQAAGSESPLG